ncbi:DNA internalization-related competence protein ComEC/Rec2 [Bacillus massilinigeriensis]|uniref:DNA internalization-related competence protein ComEC/Rec2 n=1 Tax=Bacillus mediterraneensis TaxID=1805474 RepID=UPI0008F852ED|nr:DNA internalization-related competence protein ComEC/Rec2 [Bacillus mediterraneensis]
MKGKLIYFAGAAIAGILAVFENLFLFGGLFIIFLFFLFASKRLPAYAGTTLILVSAVFGWIAIDAKNALKSEYKGTEKELYVLVDNIAMDGDVLKGLVRTVNEKEKVVLRYRLNTREETEFFMEEALPGAALRIRGRMRQPEPPRNPNAFNYRTYLERQRVFWIFDATTVSPASYNGDDSLLFFIKSFRQKQILRLNESLDDHTAALSAAMLFGSREDIDDDMEQSFQKTGTVHLLSISGLHVGLLTGALYYGLLRMGITRKNAQLLLLLLLPLYAVLTGLSPPVNRSVLMAMIFLGGQRMKIKISPLDSLSIAFLLLIALDPYCIYGAGFQLSFLATFSLILSTPKILIAFSSSTAKLIAVSIIAQVTSAPVILYFFYEMSFISVAANILLVPLFSFVILPLAILEFGLASVLPLAAVFVGELLRMTVQLTQALADFLANLPYASVIFGKPSFALLFFLSIMILFFFFLLERAPSPGKMVKLLLLPAIPLTFQLLHYYFNPEGKIVFLDVGQGDSIVIELPYRKGVYVIDTGGVLSFNKEAWREKQDAFDTGKDIVLPYLKSKGIRTVDKLILSHGDADHIGGAAALIQGIEVGEICLPAFAEYGELEREAVMAGRGANIVRIKAGYKWESDRSRFQALWPIKEEDDKNEGSIVLWAKIGGKTWLFTGDLGEDGENGLLKSINGLNIDVLKAGHHGSRHSSSEHFLDVVTPEEAVISSGRKNRYGHPHMETLIRLKERNVRIWRTDKSGAVTYTFQEDFGTFSAYGP